MLAFAPEWEYDGQDGMTVVKDYQRIPTTGWSLPQQLRYLEVLERASLKDGIHLRTSNTVDELPRSGSVETRTEFIFPRRKAPTRAAFDPWPSLMTRESSHDTPVTAKPHRPADQDRTLERGCDPPTEGGGQPKTTKGPRRLLAPTIVGLSGWRRAH